MIACIAHKQLTTMCLWGNRVQCLSHNAIAKNVKSIKRQRKIKQITGRAEKNQWMGHIVAYWSVEYGLGMRLFEDKDFCEWEVADFDSGLDLRSGHWHALQVHDTGRHLSNSWWEREGERGVTEERCVYDCARACVVLVYKYSILWVYMSVLCVSITIALCEVL